MLKHGHARKRTPTYIVWEGIKNRCLSPNNSRYPKYGGAGITICEEWRADYSLFLAAVGERPSLNHTLDRKDNSKGYEPGNVRWATQKEQQRNRTNNRLLTHAGRTMPMAQWAEELGISKTTLHARLKAGWPIDKALMTAPKQMDATEAVGLVEYRGEQMTMAQAAKLSGVRAGTIRWRIKAGVNPDRLFLHPN